MTNTDVTVVCLMTEGPRGSSPVWNTDSVPTAERPSPQFAQDSGEQNEIGTQGTT